MDNVLKFLIRNLRTVDGNRGTANGILDLLQEKEENKYAKEHKCGCGDISQSVKNAITLKNEHMIFGKVYMKYLIMRVRAKISYMALLNRMTIVELFAVAIQKAYF